MMEQVDFTRNTAQGVERIKTTRGTAYAVDQCRAVVGASRLNGEYRVKLYDHAQHVTDADYFTGDKNDAHGTAQQMVIALAAQLRKVTTTAEGFARVKRSDVRELHAYTLQEQSRNGNWVDCLGCDDLETVEGMARFKIAREIAVRIVDNNA